MAKRVAQMIEDQVNFWRINHPVEHKLHHRGQNLPIITMSREYGARGLAIARILEKRLGFKVWDKEILEIISEKLGSTIDSLSSLDEKARNTVEDTIFGFLNQKGTNLNYLLYLVRALQAIEKFGSAIIVGRGGNYICNQKKTLNVRIVAPVSHRIDWIASSQNITREVARALILKKDQEREEFTRRNFNKEIGSASDYDLLINTGTMSLEDTAELVILAYQKKTGVDIPIMELG